MNLLLFIEYGKLRNKRKAFEEHLGLVFL